jgi:hypothetical protein
LNPILSYRALEIWHFRIVHHFRQSAFLHVSKLFARIVSAAANPFPALHSNLDLTFRVFNSGHSHLAHHFHRFVFLPRLSDFAEAVSHNARLFQQLDLNLAQNFRA